MYYVFLNIDDRIQITTIKDGASLLDDNANSFVLREEMINQYLRNKAQQGVSETCIAKYRTQLKNLYLWFSEDGKVTEYRLQAWRQSLVDSGYSKITVEKYVTVINNFLRFYGEKELCIPKPVQRDLAGKTFGYLKVIEPTKKRKRRDLIWKCLCRCGNEIEVPTTLLVNNNTTSCGCLKTEVLEQANKYVEGTSLRQALLDNTLSQKTSSGYTGVYPRGDKWRATITYKKKTYNLGTFSNIEDAAKARARAKELVMEDASKLYEEYEASFGKRGKI